MAIVICERLLMLLTAMAKNMIGSVNLVVTASINLNKKSNGEG